MSFHSQRLSSSSLSLSSWSSEDWWSLRTTATTTTAHILMDWNNSAVVLLQHNELKPASKLLKRALTELKNQSQIMMMLSPTTPETQDPCGFSAAPSCSSCLSPSPFSSAAASTLPPLMSVHESMSDLSFSSWTCDSQEENDELHAEDDEDEDGDDMDNENESMYTFAPSLLSVPVLTSQLSSVARPEECALTSLLSLFNRALYLDCPSKRDGTEAIDTQDSHQDLHLMAVIAAVMLYNMALVQHVRGLMLISTRSTNQKSHAQGGAGITAFTKYLQRARNSYQTSFQIIESLSSTTSSSAEVFDYKPAILSPTDKTLFLLALLNNMSHIDSLLWFVVDIHPPLPLVDAGDDVDHYECSTMQCHLNLMHAILQRITLDGIEPTSFSNHQDGHLHHQRRYHSHDDEFQWFYTNIVVPTVTGLLVRSLAPAA